ncbi:DM DNA binding domain protein [Dictyocaulus viviparus]|uniref:DM DNA binding domain protein n=1 Tax=Dictyocaulus viviparus TaxID=29172 RepID=A0A0D8XG13_DICVI|nr:DM DNA binding domain protein [Dictyocaulus viviparus]
MALCDITQSHMFSVDSTHFNQFFQQLQTERNELLPRIPDYHKRQLALISESDSKKIYFCQRCLNHGSRLPRKNHKCECPYADCKCEFCFLVEKRRQLNSQLHNLEGIDNESMMPIDDNESSPLSSDVRIKGDLYLSEFNLLY